MDQPTSSRRDFLTAVGNLASAAWITLNWSEIAFAAEQAEHAGHAGHGAAAAPATIKTLNKADAADVDAIANLIVPGGAAPGARDAHVIYFIDNALGGFFKEQQLAFRQGLGEFRRGFAARHGADKVFAEAPEAQQIAWLHEVDETPFFAAVRRLTVLGLIALPKYGGNHDYLGWKLIGVEDSHIWTPPFGHYDRDYAGFVPYPGTRTYTA